MSEMLLVAMVVNVVAYVPSTLANATDLNAREFAVVLPFGAVLAGRTLAASLRDSKEGGRARGNGGREPPVRGRGGGGGRPGLLAPAAGTLLAGYGASLGWAAAQPSVPPMNARLAAVLEAHHPSRRIGGGVGRSGG